MVDLKSVGISAQIKKKISNRILTSMLLFFVIILSLTVLDIFKNFESLKDVLNAQCQSLEDFAVSQALINNQAAIQLKLNGYNATHPYHITWISHGSLSSGNFIGWLPFFSWEYNYQIKSFEGQNFGYFHIVGSILTDKSLLADLSGRILFMLLFVIIVFFLLYPLANKIPQQLFINPVNNLLNLLRAKTPSTPLEQPSTEFVEIQNKVLDLLRDTAEQSRKSAIAEMAAQREKEAALIKLASQVAHDIRSPLMALSILVKACMDIPEKERIALRGVANSIQDIANNLLNQYKQKSLDRISEYEQPQAVLMSAILLEVLAEKKLQYQDLSIKFDYKFDEKANFAFIKIESTNLKRMISNLINNAVDAFDNKAGNVVLELQTDNEWVKIIIQDNGKGMSADLVKKIINKISFTAGKEGGHGIGLMQVQDTLQRNHGQFAIESELGKGTKIILIFPRLTAPNWIAEEINLGPEDFVIILDDDNSIHFAWDKRFEPLLEQAPKMNVQHFKQGQEALEYINKMPEKDKAKVFLLSDYELLKQELNGLDVIYKAEVKRSVLVTSHYINKIVLDRAVSIGTKVLPKQLASEIPIKIDQNMNYLVVEVSKKTLKKADLIFIDDDKNYTDNLINYIFVNKAVDCYQDPRLFFEEAAQYPKDTKICIDNNFEGAVTMKGLDVAKKLHELGFTKLYLLSGNAFKKEDLPDYLTAAILKEDVEAINNILT